ncbi:hypothetical protein AXK12_04215 [Cephaloticoccus capnophilus]|uniref:Uncharacterized protein n=1 Tax=Cephaloticoccus capnophilus TaxID=1548208 RepID=A0A139SN89_9BACT|nr:hypothetical protein AXK12_04215 [Cephaloticoccus capnophilus]
MFLQIENADLRSVFPYPIILKRLMAYRLSKVENLALVIQQSPSTSIFWILSMINMPTLKNIFLRPQ